MVDGWDKPADGLAPATRSGLSDTLVRVGDPVSAPPARGSTIDRYKVLGEVGSGAMGVVYSAHDSALDRKVALKLVRHPTPHGRERLKREGQALARLSHPNAITVYDVGTHGEHVYIAMELVEGRTLREYLAERRRGWREVLALYLHAGEGLAAAHGAGVVHRDFKPDNVLVDKWGRVRVADFGLAALAAGDERAETREDRDRDGVRHGAGDALRDGAGDRGGGGGGRGLTRTSQAVGTPAYMAPEQYGGNRAVDARADQFGFCVALYEGLYGGRPFAGDVLIDMAQEVAAGAVAKPPPGSQVPAWLRRAVVRGLSFEPADRYPSMDALLAALRRDPARRRRRIAAAAAAALALGGVALLAVTLGHRAAEPLCRGARTRLAGAWDSPRIAAMEDAFRRSGVPGADRAWAAARRALDRYTDSWVAMHTDSCEATHLRGEQSGAVLDLRTRCLDQRLAELRALTDLFLAPDAAVVKDAARAAGSLALLAPCADAVALAQVTPPPTDAAARARVDELTRRFARVRALMTTGKYREGLEQALALAADARASGYRPIEADTLVILGRLQRLNEAFGPAEETLYDAIAAGEAGRHGQATVNAWLELIWLVGVQAGRYDEAHRMAPMASAVIRRLGDHPANLHWEAVLADAVGTMYLDEGKLDQARPHLERGLALTRRAHGADSRQSVPPLEHLANLEQYLGRHAQALELYRRARQLLEAQHGPAHPQALSLLGQEASVLFDMGRHDEALRMFEAGLPQVERVWGPQSNNAGFYLMYIGRIRQLKKDLDGALAALERAAAVMKKVHGPEHPQTARAQVQLGELLVAMDREAEALALFKRAASVHERALGPDHPDLASVLEATAEAELSAGRPGRAIAPLERALAIRLRSAGKPREPAYTRYQLARAIHRSRGPRDRVVRLLREARAGFDQGAEPAVVAEIDRWLSSPRLAEPRSQ